VYRSVEQCVVICLYCVTAVEKWKLYATSVGPGMIIGDIVVFQASAKSSTNHEPWHPVLPCTFWFGAGWYGLEQEGQLWWRWSEARGEVYVLTPTDRDMMLVGQLSVAQLPNAVDLLVDTAKVVTWEIREKAVQPFEPVRPRLKAGLHSLVFVSHTPAVRLPGDPRLLAFALRNLVLVSADGSALCEFEL
jgi:hypothetical protein